MFLLFDVWFYAVLFTLSDRPNYFFLTPLLALAPLEPLEDVAELEPETEEEPDVQDVEKLGAVKASFEPNLPTEMRPADEATTPRDEMPRSGQNTSFVRLEYLIVIPARRA
jgi:hypothetical protein